MYDWHNQNPHTAGSDLHSVKQCVDNILKDDDNFFFNSPFESTPDNFMNWNGDNHFPQGDANEDFQADNFAPILTAESSYSTPPPPPYPSIEQFSDQCHISETLNSQFSSCSIFDNERIDITGENLDPTQDFSTSEKVSEGSSSVGTRRQRQRRQSLSSMTDDERHQRIREQNNEASIRYRKSKREKIMSKDEMKEQLMEQLQQQLKMIKSKRENWGELKEQLEACKCLWVELKKHGVAIPDANLPSF